MTDGPAVGCDASFGGKDGVSDALPVPSFVGFVERPLIESFAFDRKGSDLIAVESAANHLLTGPTLASESRRSDF